MGLLTDLLTIPASPTAVLTDQVLPAMQGRGLKVTAWGELDPWHILSYMVSTLRLSVQVSIANRTAAGFGEYVFGRAQAPGGLSVTTWAGLRAASWYGVKPIAATYTKRRIRLTNTSASSYGPLAQGKMILKFPTGNRYIQDDDAVTLNGSGTAGGITDVVFRSEFPIDSANGYSYSDSSGSSPIVMVNAGFPAVTATNPAGTYTEVAQIGPGAGTVTATLTPTGSHTYRVRIDVTGNVTTASWSSSVDGAAYVSHGTATPVANIGGVGATLALTNGTGGEDPSFIAGTVYYLSNPGTDIVTVGRDAETPEQLGERCYAIWPSLGFAKDATGNWIPYQPAYTAVEAFTRSASDEVAVCLVRTSTTINNKVHILVAGQGAQLSEATLAKLESLWDVFTGATDFYEVASPDTDPIVLADATVTVRAALYASATATAQERVTKYLTGVDPNNRLSIGDGVAVIDRSYIASLIRSTPGVIHMDDGLTINGSATDYTLAVDNLATYPGNVASSLTWAIGS